MAGFGSISLYELNDTKANIYVASKSDTFGFFDIVNVKNDNYIKLKRNGNIVGEFIEIDKSDLRTIIKKLGVNITKEYYASGRKIVEGVSKLLPYSNENQNFNIQICINSEYVKVGTPALLDSF